MQSKLNQKLSLQRLAPILSASFLLGFLLFIFPFNSGDTLIRGSLGQDLWSTWTTSSDSQDYTYCMFVPVIVAYICLEKRGQLAKINLQGSTHALVWLVFGLLLFWIGARAGKQYLGCAGIQILLAGVVLWFCGRAMFRPLVFAWIFLSFAWPLPFVDSSIALPMRLMTSNLSSHVLNFIGIPSHQDGTAILSLPNQLTGLPLGGRFRIDIANPCNGLRTLMALLMLSVCYGYFSLPRLWQQWTIFLAAFPLAICGNLVRIVLLVLGWLQWGPSFAIGTDTNPSWYHEGCGFVVFAVVLGLEFLLGSFLIRIKAPFLGQIKKTAPPVADPSPSSSSVTRSATTAGGQPSSVVAAAPLKGIIPTWRSLIILTLALIMIITWLAVPPLSLLTQPGVLMQLPEEVTVPNLDGGRFIGLFTPVSEIEQRILPKDTEYCRKNYEDFHGHEVYFSIVLSGLQQYTIHPPEVCLVAQGLTIVKSEDIPIQLLSGHKLFVRNLSIQRDVTDESKEHHLVKAYYMYWYVSDGITTPSKVVRNWISSRDRVLHNQDHRWAYVIAMSTITKPPLPDGLDASQTKEMLINFIRQIIPTFQKSELPRQAPKITISK